MYRTTSASEEYNNYHNTTRSTRRIKYRCNYYHDLRHIPCHRRRSISDRHDKIKETRMDTRTSTPKSSRRTRTSTRTRLPTAERSNHQRTQRTKTQRVRTQEEDIRCV